MRRRPQYEPSRREITNEPAYTCAAAARVAGWAPRTIQLWARRGYLPGAKRFRGRWFLPKSTTRALAEGRFQSLGFPATIPQVTVEPAVLVMPQGLSEEAQVTWKLAQAARAEFAAGLMGLPKRRIDDGF